MPANISSVPLCAVWVVTYNQKAFIAQTIESIIQQKTDFPFKIYIGDDCSTDGTREICIGYKNKYPELIVLLLNSINYMAQNSANVFKACVNSGARYVAMCEGDDYWSDLEKLQRQVDFLESNPDYSICFHRIYDLLPGKEPYLGNGADIEKTYTIDDLALGNIIPTPTVMYRNNLFEFPSWFGESPVGDYVLHMLNAEKGKIKYFPQPMAVYRRNIGLWSNHSQLIMWEKWLIVLGHLKEHFKDHEVVSVLKQQESKIIAQLFSTINRLEATIKSLKEDPTEIAKSVTLKVLLASIKIKFSKKFNRKA